MGFIGFMGGTIYADLSISQRLMGIYENEEEVKKYGAMSKEELEAYARDDVVNGELIGRVPKERKLV
jgi:hypothetical protein